jgi:hypothetical protein
MGRFGKSKKEWGSETKNEMKFSVRLHKIAATCFLGLGIVFASAAGGQDLPPQTALQDIPLAEILAKSAAYCEKIKAVALNYGCRQRIEDVRYFYRQRAASPGKLEKTDDPLFYVTVKRIKFEPRRTKSNTYLYDYHLTTVIKSPSERWTLLEENGRQRNQEVAAPKDIRFNASHVVYGPVGFLAKSWQDHFRYEIVGREDLDGRVAVIVRCEPKIRGGENDNSARIWVDVLDWDILQIEWEPGSVRGYSEDGPYGYRRSIVWKVAYGIEKNGIRFPSRQFVRDFLLDDKDVKIPLEEVTFLYSDYQFFAVGNEVKQRPE